MICLFEEPTNWREKWKKSRKEAWEENASNSSSESSEEREANLCLMANEEAWSNVSDFESNNNYDHLLNAFNELHDEAQRHTFETPIKDLNWLLPLWIWQESFVSAKFYSLNACNFHR